ncbi:hypothetical protein MVEN_00057000 [Mycena venus]|uniref:Uncharacterized protein n=1 Tax=Mycena venus TaxID=2733690 RepID=A0A8H6Z7F3_9AGAR|nr:hypothetical protein MVEN_00057000 [Mycena venus]
MDVDTDEPQAVPKKTKVAAKNPRATEQNSVGKRENKKRESSRRVTVTEIVTPEAETTIGLDHDNSDDNSGPEYHVSKPAKLSKSTAVEPPTPKPKPKQAVVSDDGSEDASHSEEDEPQLADESLSGEDDRTGDRPRLIQRAKSAPVADDLLDSTDSEILNHGHRRQESVSSRDSIPPETDLELEPDDNANTSAAELDVDESEDNETKRPQRLTVQQQKYNQEERDKVMNGPRLKVRLKDCTLDYIRNVLNPGILPGTYLEDAPYTWGFLSVFTTSPNEYRKKRARKGAKAKVAMPVEPNEWEETPHGSSDDGAAFVGETGGFWKDMGFARNATFALVFVFSMMAFTRNTGTNVFPMILGLFFEIGGTSSRILNTLSNAGACVSITTIERLKKILSEDAVAHAVNLMQGSNLFYIIFDNINIFLRKSQQRRSSIKTR